MLFTELLNVIYLFFSLPAEIWWLFPHNNFLFGLNIWHGDVVYAQVNCFMCTMMSHQSGAKPYFILLVKSAQFILRSGIGTHFSDELPCLSWLKDEAPEPRFNKKMSSYQYRKSHCGDKMVVRSSYLHNGISYTGKMSSLYWIGAL